MGVFFPTVSFGFRQYYLLRLCAHTDIGGDCYVLLKTELPTEFLEKMSESLKVLGHHHRLRIVEVLDLNGEANVGEIAEACGASLSQVSQHLKLMKTIGIIKGRRNGNQIYYAMASPHSITVLNSIRKKFMENI